MPKQVNQAMPGALRFSGTLVPPVPDDFVELSAVTEPCNGTFLPQAPTFFLHGTSTTSSSLERVVHTFSKMAKNQPAYRSYLPEVQFATGIETTASRTIQPAYKMAVRDMGDFRYQLVARNLSRLQQQLANSRNLAEQNRVIGDFFGLSESSRPQMVPVLRKALLDEALGTSKNSLLKMTQAGVKKLEREAAKIPAGRPEILDSHWFFNEAQKRSIAINWDISKPSDDARTVNPRIINLEDVGRLEAKLLSLEAELAGVCLDALRDSNPKLADKSLKQIANNLAAGLMRRIAPQGNAVGHSQGGLVLELALINGLLETGDSRDFQQKADLAGRFIGFCLPVAAPVGGMKDLPTAFRDAWGFVPPGPMRKAYGDYLWKLGEEVYHAAPEVRENSPLMKKIQSSLGLLAQHQRTMISFFERDDLRVEHDEARIPVRQDSANNCFNYMVNLPDVPEVSPPRSEYEDFLARLSPKTFPLFLEQLFLPWKPASDMMKAWWSFWPQTNQTMKQMDNYFSELWGRTMPDAIQTFMKLHPLGMWMKEAGFQWYTKFRRETGQHWAPIVYPNRAFCKDISENFFRNPQHQQAALSSGNFEPFRLQAIRALGHTFRTTVHDLQTLDTFLRQNPAVVPALIENAEQGVLIAESAGNAAAQLLDEMLGLIETEVRHRPKLPNGCKNLLEILSQCKLLPTDGLDIAEKASRLKRQLNRSRDNG